MYKIYRVRPISDGLSIEYLFKEKENNIAISTVIWDAIIEKYTDFSLVLLIIVVFRDKSHKKSFNDPFDLNVLQHMDNIISKYSEDIFSMSMSELQNNFLK